MWRGREEGEEVMVDEKEGERERGYQCLSFGCLLAPTLWLTPYLPTPHSPPTDWLWQVLLTLRLPSPFPFLCSPLSFSLPLFQFPPSYFPT